MGIGVTGLFTYAYFALASHSLPKDEYGSISLLWSAVFIVTGVLYRPVEQLLSRTIADRNVRGQQGNEHLRVAATIQLGLAEFVFQYQTLWPQLMAASVLATLPIAALFVVFQRYFVAGVVASGVKG